MEIIVLGLLIWVLVSIVNNWNDDTSNNSKYDSYYDWYGNYSNNHFINFVI